MTAEIGLRAGDEMAATLMGIEGVAGALQLSGSSVTRARLKMRRASGRAECPYPRAGWQQVRSGHFRLHTFVCIRSFAQGDRQSPAWGHA